MPNEEDEATLRKEIHNLVEIIIQQRITTSKFIPSKDLVRYAGAVYDHKEIESMFNAILDGWFGIGKYTYRFEAQLSKYLGVKKTIMTNSGSSARPAASRSRSAARASGSAKATW